MAHIHTVPRRATMLTLTLGLALAGLLGAFGLPAAQAAAPPALVQPDASNGVTDDVLPTTQINSGGWVADQVIIGDTVVAGGSFSSARPAGAAAGVNESPRSNLLAYSISTGNLVDTFAPVFDRQVRVLALSPDKSRLYVGGDFTSVDGVPHSRIVAISTATGQVDPTFAATVGTLDTDKVFAISATATTVYVGGQFTSANGQNRGRLAAFRASDGQLLSGWTPKTDGYAVKALLVAPGGNVVVGGQFATIARIGDPAGTPATVANGSASLDPTTGAALPWAVNTTVKQYGSAGGVLSLKTDGTTVYGAGFWFGGTQSNYEGVWAVNPSGGSIKWLADCHGDTYDSTVANGVVYAASHQHDCSNIGSFPEQRPTRVEWRANAFTTDVRGTVLTNSLSPTKYGNFAGQPAPAVVAWFPQFANAASTSTNDYGAQPTLTTESNDDYVVVGGQFPTVNGKAQQGLVRFARAGIAPKQDGPRLYPSNAPTVRAVAGNVVRVTAAPWDRDSAVLSSVQLWRTDKSAPVWSARFFSSSWWQSSLSFVDKNVTTVTSYRYYVKMTDPNGNTATSSTVSVTPSGATLTDSAYSSQVLADGATSYWRLDDAAGLATDWAGNADLTLASGATLGAPGALDSDPALSLNASSNASAASNVGFTRAPQTFSAEAWFKNGSSTGGQVVGFGDVPSGTSYRTDRKVYLNAAGNLVYYLDQNGTSRTITSPKTYNDNAWHQVVATLSAGSGMVLYVDGARVASWAAMTSSRDYGGFWRVGADKLPGTATGSLGGTIDDVSIYPTALSAAQVKDHYTDSGRTAATSPTAAFTSACTSLACGFDGSSSSASSGAGSARKASAAPADGSSITDWAWTFGDGGDGGSSKPSHTFAKSGTFPVSLTVTANDGSAASVTQDVTPSSTTAPVARMSTSTKGTTVSVDGSRSSGRDGELARYRWTFGDGATSSKKKTTHRYVGNGSYAVGLTVTDDLDATATAARRVVTGGRVLAYDTFDRTGTSWARALKGGTWSLHPRSAFSANDGTGRLTLTDPGSGATALLSKVSTTKADVLTDVTVDQAALDAGGSAGVVLRAKSDDRYLARLTFGPDGTVALVATRVVDGRSRDLGTVEVPRLAYAAGDVLRLRATVSGGSRATLRLTVWKDGTREPAAQLSVRDSSKALRRAGTVGLAGSQSQAASGSPAVLTFDNFFVTSS